MTMSQVILNAGTLLRPRPSFLSRPYSPPSPNAGRSWTQLQRRLNCNGRFSCLFSDNRRERLRNFDRCRRLIIEKKNINKRLPCIVCAAALDVPSQKESLIPGDIARSFNLLLKQRESSQGFAYLVLPDTGNNHLLNQDRARKALESALGGKKNEFEKWNKEIKRREEAGGGGGAAGGGGGGGGGWFGWAGRFGWSDDGNFWQEAQQTSLTVLGIVLLYLVIVKGELILAVVLNPLLFALRGMRSGLTVVTTKITRASPQLNIDFDPFGKTEARGQSSAKEEVLRKWGSD